MQAGTILLCVAIYTLVLFGVTWLTSRGASNETYFVGNRSSRWYLVAYGMIGASLSGVTFMSVPGDVGKSDFAYFQTVLGYFVGYFIVAYILLPLYYRMKLTSIYTYLETRLGIHAYKTGAFFFLLSRILGAGCRMFIVVLVLQKFVFDAFGVPFGITAAIFILLILGYTFKGGVKTIVWTDAFQTTFMLLSLVLTVVLISREMNFGFGDLFTHIADSPYSQIVNTDWKSGAFFPKAFFGGMFIAVTMTGMDQEMMQKNISCKTIGEAKKNMISFSFIMVVVNLIFLALGVLLWTHAQADPEMALGLQNKSLITDELFPTIALNHLGTVSALFFIIGLISAAFPSADGALTALTASFCIDFLGFNKLTGTRSEAEKVRLRKIVHIGFAVLLLGVLLVLKVINAPTIIMVILFLASITYGPLLGLFAFGIFTKRTVKGWGVVIACVIPPVICYVLRTIAKSDTSGTFLGGYQFGNELLIINGLLTFTGLFLISKKPAAELSRY
ncbi:MAG: sodium:solute symporter [Bacteroidota bacterium]|nr:sodium:solute symporter [Bacteroidota bacterium]